MSKEIDMPQTKKTTCVLCGGDGYVSEETAHAYGRHLGDTTCPSCDGAGRVVDQPLPPHPNQAPREDDWVCPCGDRNRKRWLYCHRAGCPRPEPR